MSHLAPGCLGYYFKDAIRNAFTQCLHDDLRLHDDLQFGMGEGHTINLR